MKYENISGFSDEHFITWGGEKKAPSLYFPQNKLAQNIFSNSIFKDKQLLFSLLSILFSPFSMLCNNKTLFTAHTLYEPGFISKALLGLFFFCSHVVYLKYVYIFLILLKMNYCYGMVSFQIVSIISGRNSPTRSNHNDLSLFFFFFCYNIPEKKWIPMQSVYNLVIRLHSL